MRALVESQLSTPLPALLIMELLDAYDEAKRDFYLGGLRLSAVEGGAFCEASFPLLEKIGWNGFTPLGKQIDSEKLINRLAGLGTPQFPDSVRLHITRSLRLVYDIRNKRDTAHLADGIDPNTQDATLVVRIIDWVLAEFVRIYHNVSADQAARIVDQIVTKVAPVVQDFSGFLKVLSPSLGPTDRCLVLLYHRGRAGADYAELSAWMRPSMRANLTRTLNALADRKDLAHFDGKKYFITQLGERDVEARKLIVPAQLVNQ